MNPARSGWRYGTLGIIALFTALLIIRWHTLPVFLDIYYHAGCMTGFRDAGGIVLHDFWEYAPIGRPHLYPPLFHIILLGLSKTGLPTLFVLRLVSVAIYPLFLFTISWVLSRLYNDRCAFFTVLAATLPYTFLLNIVAAIPSSIALIILALLFYAVETESVICGILLLGLSFYTHGGLPWITILTLLLYAILRRKNFKLILSVMAGGIVLGSPWLIHLARNRGYFFATNSYINHYFEANILLYVTAIFGIFIVLKERGRGLFYLAMAVAMTPMIKDYAFRFWCNEGLLPLIFLAGLGFDKFYSKAEDLLRKNARLVVYLALLPWIIFYLATFYSPVIHKDGDKLVFSAPGSSFLKFTKHDPNKATALESSIYVKKYMEELSGLIKASTRPDEIIYCNYNYVGGILYVFSDRAISDGMLNEVRPAFYSDPASAAALIIWIKNPEGVFDPELKALIARLGLIKIAETEIAYVYRNPVVMAHKTIAKPVIPAWMAFAILILWLIAVFVCIARHY